MISVRLARPALILAVAAMVAACGGGGGSTIPSGGGSTGSAASATPTATPGSSQGTFVAVAPKGSASLGTVAPPAGSGITGSITASIVAPSISAGSASTFEATLASQAGGAPAPSAVLRRPGAIGAAFTALVYVGLESAQTVTITAPPSLSIGVPGLSGAAVQHVYLAMYNPANSAAGWTVVDGPATDADQTLGFSATGPQITLTAGLTVWFAVISASSALPTPTPAPVVLAPIATPTPTGAAPPSNEALFACPTGASSASIARSAVPESAARRMFARRAGAGSSSLIEVVYASTTLRSDPAAVARRETAAGATALRSLTFSHAGLVAHVLAVAPSTMSASLATLRATAGVVAAAPVGRRFTSGVSGPYLTNDPYFAGFSPANVAPYYESANVPGQWDMHALRLEDAFAYSQASTAGTHLSPAALGSRSAKLAIIDTGVDPTHPEVQGQLVSQRCFITDPNNNQSTGTSTADPNGHGTDVAGIAAAASDNGLGFTGVAGNVSLYGYRVFPTPDSACDDPSNAAPECGAATTDIASAIEDAVEQHVNVISMSLGGVDATSGKGCDTSGVDSDPVEGAAVADAIDAGVIVVAAAGNEGTPTLDAPACDSGVIAVGATSLDDGQPNGSSVGPAPAGRNLRDAVGTAAQPVEYVAADYSNSGGAAIPGSAAAWGIVAPGGDPSGDTDADGLHWIENIWTSTPYESGDAGACTVDYQSTSTTPDCRTLIAGTSMATPHVAGAAALVIAVSGANYASPAAMKQLLCATADDLGDPLEGCGRLDVYRAIAVALGDADPGP